MVRIPSINIPIVGVDKFSNKMDKSMAKIDNVGRKMQDVGKKLTLGITLPIVGAGTAMTLASNKINKSLAEVGTLIPGQREKLKKYKEEVQNLSIEYGKSTGKMSEGLYQVLSALGDNVDTIRNLETASKLALGGRATVMEGVDLLTAVTQAYGDTSAETMQRVADLSFTTMRYGKTTIPELAQKLQRVTPLASDLGVNLKSLFGTMATTAGVTGDTAEAATQFAGVLTALRKPPAEMTKAFSKLNVETGKQLIQEEGFRGALNKLVDISEKTELNLGKMLGRKEALIMTTALTGKAEEAYINKLQKMKNVTGATDQAVEEQRDGINKLGFQFDVLREKVRVLGERFGDTLGNQLISIVDLINPVLDKLLSMDEKSRKLVITIGVITAIIPPLIAIGGVLASMFASVATALTVTGVSLVSLVSPVGIAIAGIIGLVTVITLVWKKSKEFGLNIKDVFTGISSVLLSFFNPFLMFIPAIISNFKRFIPYFKLIGIGIGALVKTAEPALKPILGLFETLGDTLDFIVSKIFDFIDLIARIALPDWLENRIGLSNQEVTSPPEIQNSIAGLQEQKSGKESSVKLEFDNLPDWLKAINTETGEEIDKSEGVVFGGGASSGGVSGSF